MPPISPPYHAMTAFAAPAMRRSELWRTLVGLVLWAVFSVLIGVALLIPVAVLYGADGAQALAGRAMATGTPAGVIGALVSFSPMLLGMAATVLTLMRRNPLTLLGPFGGFVRNFGMVGLPLMALWLVLLPLVTRGGDVTPHQTLAGLLPWLPAALCGLLIQTATEEVFFRGYLQQQLAARFSARWVWLVLPALLFGLLHYSGHQGWPMGLMTVVWAAAFGLAAADLTARSGNLGAALALHFTNNISAILLVGYGGPLGGLSLYLVNPGTAMAALQYFALDAASLAAAWGIARAVLRR